MAELGRQTDRHLNQDKARPPCDPDHVLSRGSDSASQRARSDLQVCLASSERIGTSDGSPHPPGSRVDRAVDYGDSTLCMVCGVDAVCVGCGRRDGVG